MEEKLEFEISFVTTNGAGVKTAKLIYGEGEVGLGDIRKVEAEAMKAFIAFIAGRSGNPQP